MCANWSVISHRCIEKNGKGVRVRSRPITRTLPCCCCCCWCHGNAGRTRPHCIERPPLGLNVIWTDWHPFWFRNFRRTFWFPQKEPKWSLSTRHISLPQNIPKCFCCRDSTSDPAACRSSQRSPDLLAGVGGHFLTDRGREVYEMEGREGKGRLRKRRREGLAAKRVD